MERYHQVPQIKESSDRQWQLVLPDVLHSIRLLLCTSTNETPHERFMNFSRRASIGSSIPSWLAEPGPVYVKRHVRHRKFDPLVEKANVLQANPHYAHIRYPDGRETTVSTKHLAPYGHVEHVEAPTSTQVPTARTKTPGALPQDNSRHADKAPTSTQVPTAETKTPGALSQDNSHHADKATERIKEPESMVLRRSQRER